MRAPDGREIDPRELSDEELKSLRVDLGRVEQVRRSEANQVARDMEAITSELRHRANGGRHEISDHALVRYLERAKGIDTEYVRREMAGLLEQSDGETVVKGEAIGKVVGDLVFVIAHNKLVVTVYPARDHDKARAARRRK